GEALSSTLICSQRHQFRRRQYPGVEPVELVLAVGVAEDEARQIMAGEGLLCVGQGFVGGGRIGPKTYAIATGIVALLVGPFGAPTGRFNSRGRAELELAFRVDALIPEAAVIDADVAVEFG